jgi:hypothetical protein
LLLVLLSLLFSRKVRILLLQLLHSLTLLFLLLQLFSQPCGPAACSL